MIRQGALRAARGHSVLQELTDRGIHVRAARRRTLVEKMPEKTIEIVGRKPYAAVTW